MIFYSNSCCTQDRRHPRERAFLEDMMVELWGIGRTQVEYSYDELLTQLSSAVHCFIKYGMILVIKDKRQGCP